MRYLLLILSLFTLYPLVAQKNNQRRFLVEKEACYYDTTGMNIDPSYADLLFVADSLNIKKPSLCDIYRQDALLKMLKSEGIWDSLDIFYALANDGSREFGYLNWKKPRAHTLNIVQGLNTPANTVVVADTIFHWTPRMGIYSKNDDYYSYYINTNYFPSTDKVAYRLLNASIFISGFNPSDTLTIDQPYGPRIYGKGNLGLFTINYSVSGMPVTVMPFEQFVVMHQDGGTSYVTKNLGSLPGNDYYFRLISAKEEASPRWEIIREYSDLIQSAPHIPGNEMFPTSTIHIQPGSLMGVTFIGAGSSLRFGDPKGFVLRDIIQNYNRGISTNFEPEYLDILEYAQSQGYELPSYVQRIQQDSIIKRFKANGIWNDLDIFYLFAHDSDSKEYSYINWKSPGNFDLTTSDDRNVLFSKNKGIRTSAAGIPNLSTGYSALNNATNFMAGGNGYILTGDFNINAPLTTGENSFTGSRISTPQIPGVLYRALGTNANIIDSNLYQEEEPTTFINVSHFFTPGASLFSRGLSRNQFDDDLYYHKFNNLNTGTVQSATKIPTALTSEVLRVLPITALSTGLNVFTVYTAISGGSLDFKEEFYSDIYNKYLAKFNP